MSYTPINTGVFNAAFSGAVASMAASGFLFQQTAISYENVTQIAGAFAQAFDTVWNSAAGLNNMEEKAIQEICAQNFRDHMPVLTQSNQVIPATFTAVATAIRALVVECDVYYVAQGIVPGGGGTPGGIVDPYDPASYLPAGTTPLMVDLAHGWKPYILAALAAVELAQLGNRVYPVNSGLTMDDYYSIVGLGSVSEILAYKDGATSYSVIDGVTNIGVRNNTLKNFTIDSQDLMKDTNQVFYSHPDSLTIQDFKWYGYGNALNSTQGISGINIQGYAPNLLLDTLYSRETQAGTSGDLTGLIVYNANSAPTTFVSRLNNVQVDGGNVLKQCVELDGFYNRNFRIDQMTVQNSAFTGLIVGYNAPNALFYAIISDLVGSNCGGSAIYCTGNDGGPTYNTVAYGTQITGAMVDSCGGIDGGVFNTGIGMHHRYGSVVGCFVFNAGKQIDGTPRAFNGSTIAIDTSAIAESHYNVTGNWTSGSYYGYSSGEWTKTLTFVGNEGWNHGQAASLGLSIVSGVNGQLTATGNTLMGTQYALSMTGAGAVNDGTYNISGNTLFNPNGGIAVRLSLLKNGTFRNNTVLGSTPGVQVVSDMATYVGLSFMIDGNHFVFCGENVNVASAPAQTQWSLVGPNTNNNYGVSVAASGPVPAMIKYCQQNGQQRWVENNAVPLAGQMPGGVRYGDQIMRTSLDTLTYAYLCTNAAVDPGTWNNLVVV